MPHRPHVRRTTVAVAVAVLLGGLALSGCSSTSSNHSSAPMNAAPGAPAAPGANGAKAADAAPNGSGTSGNQSTLTPIQERSIIYTGTITVRVDSVVPAADQAAAIATGTGGIVAGDNRTIDANRSQATLVLRVPADHFSSTLDALAKLGTESSRQVSADDVTETMIDLDARIADQEASVSRVRALLAQAQSISDIVSIEGELTRRQADLDSLTQRRAKMAGLVDLATITVNLDGPDVQTDTGTGQQTGFLAGLRNGWHGFLTSVAGVLTVAGFLLPWAIVIGLPLWLVLWLARRRRRTNTVAPASASPGTPKSE
jgi:hypothetical protein